MAEPTNTGNGGGSQPSAGEARQTQVRVLGQYIKDLSFENPNISKMLENPGEPPNLRVEVNVNAGKIKNDIYESAILLKAEATSTKLGTIYDLELAYAGMFQIENMPEQAMEQFLLINCPSLLFPFARRLAADLTREGGFPPLLLDPIDFVGLYVKRQQEQQAHSQSKPIN
jgi:preprotein translocase subunit SecB